MTKPVVDVESVTRIWRGNAKSWNVSEIPLGNWEGDESTDENHEVYRLKHGIMPEKVMGVGYFSCLRREAW